MSKTNCPNCGATKEVKDFPIGFSLGSQESKNYGMTCKNCRWRSDDFTSVCVNSDSPKLADFVSAEDTCAGFEKRTEVNGDGLEGLS